MGVSVLLDPHGLGDDGVLFACFTLLRHRPHVICVLRSHVQQQRYGITAAQREAETAAAFGELGVTAYEQWPFLDSEPVWFDVRRQLLHLEQTWKVERVFAPAFEVGGHEHHNALAEVVAQVFPGRVTSYLTYVRGSGRSDWGAEVVPEPEWIALKHRALACFGSQIGEPSTRPWFMDGLREWVAA